MKRVIVLIVFVCLFSFALAGQECKVKASVLNQDPIPAVPGEEMEVVFVLEGIDSTNCGTIEFEVLEEFPFKVLEGFETKFTISSGTFTRDFNSHKTIPVKFRVNKDALDGDTPLEVRYKASKGLGEGFASKRFNISVEDVRADFEVFVSEYNYQTKEITFEILNIGENDIEAVTVQIPQQDGVYIEGADRENIGDLSSNEDTSSEFKMNIESDSIHLIISYSDSINVRRTIEKDVPFNGALFASTQAVEQNNSWQWIVGAVVVVVLFFFWRRRSKKKKK